MKNLYSAKGFTLLEMLVSLTVAAILIATTLNVYASFAHGMGEASNNYVRFATENANELRCRTRFVRGLSPCDTALREFRTFRESRAFRESRESIRSRF